MDYGSFGTMDFNSIVQQENIFPIKSDSDEVNNVDSYIQFNRKHQDTAFNQIYYISDIHLDYKKNEIDSKDTVKTIVTHMLRDISAETEARPRIILIGGDVSYDINMFELFVETLNAAIRIIPGKTDVIFVLGNHEYWNQNKSVEDIVLLYRGILNRYKMHLLHNEIIWIDEQCEIHHIDKPSLHDSRDNKLTEELRKAQRIFFGGTGFSGCNTELNALSGMYKNTINRKQEIELSAEISSLYDVIKKVLKDKTVIVFTHMDLQDWKGNNEPYQKKWIYIYGHSHSNYYFDDGERRVYGDNQVGYSNRTPRLRYLFVDRMYDWFGSLDDGIYIIGRHEYIDFYREKNVFLTCSRDFNKLYMLKKQGYYCFIHENRRGRLCLLNGGALHSLRYKDLKYYYKNMDVEIHYVLPALLKFQEIQRRLSDEIKQIGGNGQIHGAIIDIDGDSNSYGPESIAYCHLYVNPIDLTITPYYALDMELKAVYPCFSALIHDKCPALYNTLKRLPSTMHKNALILRPVNKKELTTLPKLYLKKDIYEVSRKLNKLQKLNANLLNIWFEDIPGLIPTVLANTKQNELAISVHHKPALNSTEANQSSAEKTFFYTTPHSIRTSASDVHREYIDRKLLSVQATTITEDGRFELQNGYDIKDNKHIIYLQRYLGHDKSVVIPDNITHISTGAFKGNQSIEKVVVSKTIELVGKEAFAECTNLQAIEFCNPVTQIRRNAFSDCRILQTVILPSELTVISNSMFKGCKSLKTIEIPKSVKVIGANALDGCVALLSIDLPALLESIDENAFYDCEVLENLTIPQGITTINAYICAHSGIKKINIPSSVSFINQNAFAFCKSLVINYNGTSTDWINVGKAPMWDGHLQHYTVICTDKIIEKP